MIFVRFGLQHFTEIVCIRTSEVPMIDLYEQDVQ
jgi:hypothetical protein